MYIITSAVRSLNDSHFTVLAGQLMNGISYDRRREAGILRARDEIRKCEEFFRGDWFEFLAGCLHLDYSGEWLIEKCRDNGYKQFRTWKALKTEKQRKIYYDNHRTSNF